ncbi:DUF3800 domain-containing protein [Halococcus sp. IIIV-5B]|uniref:DUF3800 domain-containing protein n=1 Tax=Halococcus sp. IIIV-5B TaxID=2321230 RepID=UPI0013148D9A
MGPDLHIFVDESGDYAHGDRYVVAGCWCISQNKPQHIFDGARSNLANHLRDGYGFQGKIKELKGNQLPNEHLGDIMNTFEQHVYQDGTISDPPYPWEGTGQPFRYSTESFRPVPCKEILSNYMSEVDAPGALQRLALMSLLSPLTVADQIDLSKVDSVNLTLDAEVWRQPAKDVTDIVDLPDDTVIEFSTRDSKATPGIQIADLAAYARARYLRDGSCSSAARFVRDRCFS